MSRLWENFENFKNSFFWWSNVRKCIFWIFAILDDHLGLRSTSLGCQDQGRHRKRDLHPDVLDYGEMTVRHNYVQEVADFTHKMYRTIARMRQDPHFSSRAIETLKRSGGFSRRALELGRRGVAIVEE